MLLFAKGTANQTDGAEKQSASSGFSNAKAFLICCYLFPHKYFVAPSTFVSSLCHLYTSL